MSIFFQSSHSHRFLFARQISARVAESVVEWMVLLGPRALHELCPDLTLTMAATERALFSYAEALLMHAGGGKAAGPSVRMHPPAFYPSTLSPIHPTPHSGIKRCGRPR